MLAIVGYFSRSLWAGPLIGGLAPVVASAFDIDLEIEGATGDGTSQLELIGVRIGSLGQGQAVRSLRAESLALDFSLFDLVLGRESAVQRIQSVRLDAELDFSQPDPESTDETAASEFVEAQYLPLPELQLDDSNITILLPNQTQLELRSADLLADANGRAVALDAETFEYREAEFAPISSRLVSRFDLDANGIQIDELEWEERLSLRNSAFQWRTSGAGGLAWEANLEALGGDAEFGGQLQSTGELALTIKASRMDLAELGQLVPNAPALGGHLENLTGELHWPMGSSNQITGQLDTRAQELTTAGSEPMDLKGQLTFEDGFIRSQHIELSSADNRLDLTQVELPIELDKPIEQLRRGRFDLEVNARNLPRLLGTEAFDAAYGEHHLVVFLALDHGVASVQRGQFESEGGVMKVESGTIRAMTNSGPTVELDLFAEFEDLAPVGKLFGAAPWRGALSGQVKVNGTWPGLRATAELTGQETRIANVNLGQVEARLEIDRERIVIAALNSANDFNRLSLSGAISQLAQQPTFEDLTVDVEVSDLSQLLPGLEAEGQLRITGNAAGAIGQLTGEWSLDGEELRVGTHAFNQFIGSGSFDNDLVKVDELNFENSGINGALSGVLQLDQNWGVRSLELSNLTLAGLDERLALQEPTSISFESAWPTFDSLALGGSVGSINVHSKFKVEVTDLNSSQARNVYRFGFTAAKFAPMALVSPFVSDGYVLDGVTGELSATHDGNQLGFSSKLNIDRFELPLAELTESEFDHPWQLNWDAELADGLLQVKTFEASSGDASELTLSGSLPIKPLHSEPLAEGPFDLRAQLALPELAAFRALAGESTPWPNGQLSLSAEMNGTWKQPAGSLAINAHGLGLDVEGESLFQQAEIDGAIQIGAATRLDQFRVSIPEAFSLLADGSLDQALDFSSLAAGDNPFSPQTPVQLHLDLNVEDSTWLNRLHQSLGTGDLFHRFGGQVSANLDIAGTIANPLPTGQLEFANGEFKISPELPTIQNMRGVVSVDQRRFGFEEFAGDLGGESLQVTGHFDLAEHAPELDVTLTGTNLLLYRASGVKLRSNVALAINGTPDAPRVEGELRLTDSRFVKRYDFLAFGRGGAKNTNRALPLFSFRDAPLSDLAFDVSIESETPFRIDNNVAKARIRPDLRLSGTGQLPELSGVLYVDGGKVALPVNDLFLRPGTIRFERNDPMIPKVELLLQNRIRGYDVTLTVQGDYDDPTVTTSSSPPLGPEDLAALVWTGQDPGEGLSSKTGKSSAQAVGAFIVQDLLTRLFSDESTETEESFINRFELYLGRDTTQSGAETIEMTYEVTENVFGSSDTLYLATERDVYSHVNFGVRFVFRFH